MNGQAVITTGIDTIAMYGNRGHFYGIGALEADSSHIIECVDGFRLSVIAGGGTHCTPRPVMCTCWYYRDGGLEGEPFAFEPSFLSDEVPHDFPGPYRAVEVGFPSARPEPWRTWIEYAEEPTEPTKTVYGYVPVEMVRELIALHGGEVEKPDTYYRGA